MTATARELLAVFDALEPAEKQQVAAEILRRSAGPDDLPPDALNELADDLFRAYDAEETSGAQS